MIIRLIVRFIHNWRAKVDCHVMNLNFTSSNRIFSFLSFVLLIESSFLVNENALQHVCIYLPFGVYSALVASVKEFST